MEMLFGILALAPLGVAIACLSARRRVRRQLREMSEALADVKSGNGNRRVLSAPGELTSPLAYQINEIVRSYEDRLAAYRKREEANRQLMTSLSHDVRTPLTTLIGYLDAVQAGVVEGEERDGYVETARRKAHDLKEYVDVLFDWFKLNSDEFPLDPVPMEMAELTRNVLADWIPVFEEKGIAYEVDIPEAPLMARLDADAYARIVGNIVQNAVSHSQAGRVTVRMSRQDGSVRLCVADDGIGIGEEDLGHIFERLYKCDRSRSERGGGLGLSISRQLTERMGGTIRAESAPGRGTTFTLLFPLVE